MMQKMMQKDDDFNGILPFKDTFSSPLNNNEDNLILNELDSSINKGMIGVNFTDIVDPVFENPILD